MSQFHINKDGQQMGPFNQEELSAGLNSGRFSQNDLVWKVGTADWVPLSTIVAPPLPMGSPLVPQQISLNSPLSSPPAKEGGGCLRFIGYAVLTVIGLGIIGAMFGDSDSSSSEGGSPVLLSEEQKAKEAFQRANDGNAIIAKAFEGTSFQKEQYEQRHLGRRYYFKGNVTDVKSERRITVMLDAGNHANVTFDTTDVSSFKEDKVVYFSAVIEAFGTGILINHDLGEAKLEDL